MKKLKSISRIITLFVVITLYFAISQENLFAIPLNPRITFTPDHLHFEKIIKGENQNYKVHFQNDGTTKLIIHSAKVLGVLESSVSSNLNGDKMEYEPGDSGDILVKFNSNDVKGEKEILILIESNDSVYPNSVFEIVIDEVK